MATRGYFRIRNSEFDSDDPYYGFSDEYFLIEAYHDGYLSDMLQDILAIPERAAKLARQGVTQRMMLAADFNPIPACDLHPENNGDGGGRFASSRFASIRELPEFANWCFRYSAIPALSANDSVGLITCLQLTKPNKYERIMPGVARYGRPVTQEDASFAMEFSEDGVLCTLRSTAKTAAAKADFKEALASALFACRATKCVQKYATSVHESGLQLVIPFQAQSVEMYWRDYIRPYLNPPYKKA